jgi:hypothetical protein
MEHWLKILREEEEKIRLYEESLKQKNNPALDTTITALETTDKGLKSILDSQSQLHKTKICELLKNHQIFNALAGAIGDYNRGLFTLKKKLDDPSLVEAIRHRLDAKYSQVSLVFHYDGYIFDPNKKESWDDFKSMDDGKYLAIYGHHEADFVLAKSAIDLTGCLIGDEVEIPFLRDNEDNEARYTGDPESQVEKLTCSDYKFDFSPKNPINLTESSIKDIVRAATVPAENQANHGIVDLIHENRKYDATDALQMCMLNGKEMQTFNFILKGGFVKDSSYTLFEYLTKAAANPPKSE